jgi:hypothetical protein
MKCSAPSSQDTAGQARLVNCSIGTSEQIEDNTGLGGPAGELYVVSHEAEKTGLAMVAKPPFFTSSVE